MMKGVFRFLLILSLLLADGSYIQASESAGSHDPDLLLLAARNAVKAGDREKAAERYRRLIRKFPGVAEGHREYGWLLIEAGDYQAGLDHLQQWEAMTSKPGEAQDQLIEVLLLARQFSKAGEVVQSSLQHNPGNARVRWQRGKWHQAQRRWAPAESIFTSLLGTSVDKESRVGLYELALMRGDLKRARSTLNRLRQHFPQDRYLLKHQVLLSGRLGRIAEAYALLASMSDGDLRAVNEAELLSSTGQYFLAEERFRDLLKERPSDYALMMGLGRALVGQQREGEGVKVFTKVLKSYPEDVEVRLALAELLFHQRRWKEGEPVVAKISKGNTGILEGAYLSYRWKTKSHQSVAGFLPETFTRHVRDVNSAHRAQNYLIRFQDWKHVGPLSTPYVNDQKASLPFFANWIHSLHLTDRNQGAQEVLQTLRGRRPDDRELSLAAATLDFSLGQRTEAMHILEKLPSSVEKGRLLMQLGEWERAVENFSQIKSNDPDETPAQVKLAKSLAKLGKSEEVKEIVARLFDDCPQNGWPALVRVLLHPEGSSPVYVNRVGDAMEARGLDDPLRSLDSRVNYVSVLSQQERGEELLSVYKALIRDYPQQPMIQLGLARAMAQYRRRQESHQVIPVVRAYDRYLSMKPYDEAIWVEKARFLGWSSEYERAKQEYGAMLTTFPEEESLRLEERGKREFWRGHDRAAWGFYQKALLQDADNEEILGDLGQIHSSRVRFVDSQSYYRRLLGVNPGHRLGATSLSLAQEFHRPQVTLGIGYVKMDGFDGSVLTKYVPITGEIFAPLSSDLWVGAGYQWVNFDISGPPSSASIGRIMARYSTAPYWHVDGYLAGVTYSGTDHSNINFGAGVSYEWESGVKGRAETRRQDLWQNATTVERNISYHSYSVGTEFSLTEEVDLSAGAGYWDYSDDNWNVNGQFAGSYALLPFPHPLRITYQLDAFGFKRKRAYFSPSFFAKNTLALGWQHFLGFPRRKEHHGETPVRNRFSGSDIYAFLGWPTRPIYHHQTPLNSYALDYAVSLDDESNFYHQVTASFAYAFTRRCHVQVSGMLIRANVVDQDSVNGFLRCHL